jgi:phosphinothricin acetyltransferase
MTPTKLVQCSYAQHASSILEILNDAIVNSTALYDYKPRAADSMVPWFLAKERDNYPVIGIEESGQLLGFATYGAFRNWPAYKYSVEHSLYVRSDQRGRGVGKRLLTELIECARRQNLHVLVGGIDASNETSIRLHTKLGFTHAGTVRHAGYKFGRWLDLAFYQLILETPRQPVEG